MQNERLVSHPNPTLEAVLQRLMTIQDQPWCDTIEAIAVGGSLARGLADRQSDLDLFALASSSTDMDNVCQLALAWLGASNLQRGPQEIRGLGILYTGLTEDLSICQITVNTRETLEPHPMRASSIVLFDRTGYFTRIVGESAAATRTTASDAFEEAFGGFWLRALQGWRAYQQGQLWRSLGYLGEMQKFMLQILRLRNDKYDASGSPMFPATRVELDLGGVACQELSIATAPYDREAIARAYRAAASWFSATTSSLGERYPVRNDLLRTSERIAKVIAKPL